MGVSEPGLNLDQTRATPISLEMGSLEDPRMAENSADVFLRCVHSLEFIDWFMKLEKYMTENVIYFTLM